MPIPPLELHAIEIKLRDFCDRVPNHVRNQLLHVYSINGQTIVLSEKRPHWQNPSEWFEAPVAKFKYVAKKRKWQLFWQDRNLHWRRYEPMFEADKFDNLLKEVDSDPTCIFWG